MTSREVLFDDMSRHVASLACLASLQQTLQRQSLRSRAHFEAPIEILRELYLDMWDGMSRQRQACIFQVQEIRSELLVAFKDAVEKIHQQITGFFRFRILLLFLAANDVVEKIHQQRQGVSSAGTTAEGCRSRRTH